MSNLFWQVFTFGSVGISVAMIVFRIIAIRRLPVHLRWELAPVPHEKEKGRYGGSYLEEYEWWKKTRRMSHIAPLVYMAKEILFLRGVWERNRKLWPATFAFHGGLYLIVAMLSLYLFNVVLSSSPALSGIASAVGFLGYLLGGAGAIGLVLKRIVDPDLRPFNSVSTYVNLIFLAAVFVSGTYAWFRGQLSDVGLFMKGLAEADSNMNIGLSLSVHIVISLLFILYLPLTNMTHFAAKYFMYHDVRWNDAPGDVRMEQEVETLRSGPVAWSAPHARTDGRKDEARLTVVKNANE